MRHILIHHYFGVELENVWEAVERDIPDLRKNVLEMLAGLADQGLGPARDAESGEPLRPQPPETSA
jgi:uncharacterized protein YutE (UPF0331/DUF86 family)